MLARIIFVSLLVCFAANAPAAPTFEVSRIFFDGMVDWTVTLTPDPDLPPPGGTGTISAEIGFEFREFAWFQGVAVGPDMSAAEVPAGHNPFAPLDTSGLFFDVNTDSAFVSVTGEYSSTNQALVLATLTTRYFDNLAFGGQTILAGTSDEFIGARITQDSTVFDGITSFLPHRSQTLFDANVDGRVNNDDIPDFVVMLLSVADWEALHPGENFLLYADGDLN
ncbi:MAG: hypothetical protein ACR2NU_10870, partial [Aeoliella sp.]